MSQGLTDDAIAAFKANANLLKSLKTQQMIHDLSVPILLEPQAETLAKKIITERYSATIKGLLDPINRVTGYIKLAKSNLKVTPNGFGMSALRLSIDKNDVEGVIANLHIVLGNIRTYKASLAEQGLTDELIDGLTAASQSLAADKLQQFEIISNRRSIVQNNLGLLNDSYEQGAEILSIGKILYKGKDAAKQADYTFAELLKKVRQVSKPVAPKTKNSPILPEK
jgi:translation elongation factor EF-1beta